MRVLITGGNGIIGTTLVDLPYEKVFLDITERHYSLAGEAFVQGSVSDKTTLSRLLDEADIVIHAAGISDSQTRGEEIDTKIMDNNFTATKLLFDLAWEKGLSKIVFLSSNHAIGMEELLNAPDIYTAGGKNKVTDKDFFPDSFYGVSKVFGEMYGKYMAHNGGPKFISLRVGSVRSEIENHPFAYAEHGVRKKKWERWSPEYVKQYNRLKAIWQSRRDFLQLAQKCIEYDGPEKYLCFYGVSQNEHSWFELDNAKKKLGYEPMDSADEIKLEDCLSDGR
ncbi:NAD-dependent epimerase/dehydratase family protein [Roseivirga sp.]|uniref:NAD-dependent epimerase/dehydratase family protein n=1 Tax=Roseivirga sp. TaxID=1964215 RepID=UPI003B8BC0D1